MLRSHLVRFIGFLVVSFGTSALGFADPLEDLFNGHRQLSQYFEAEVSRIEKKPVYVSRTRKGHQAEQASQRRELQAMLGLYPWPERTPLETTVTSVVEAEEYVVKNLHFQSMPGLYVTGNLYVPKGLSQPVPAVLYVCGHARQIIDGVSYGNKTAYHHHGVWFARHGYVCLTIDTVQLGEIEGIHHGTYHEGMWWWNSRGYTPAGVEAWNSIRALDLLASLEEVDERRMGITGRSGGGGYSWWAAALDERVKAAVPVAGVTDLRNHVIDGVVEGHCDCMYYPNTYGWDFATMISLVAPRALLIANSDKDDIFPLDGVVRSYQRVAPLWEQYGESDRLGLLITEGPHKDTQDLRVPAFRWFNKHLKGENPLIEVAATKVHRPHDLKVFSSLPEDERSSTIHETFVPKAEPPANEVVAKRWATMRTRWMAGLRSEVFGAWPKKEVPLEAKRMAGFESSALVVELYAFHSQEGILLPLYVVTKPGGKPTQGVAEVLRESEWNLWVKALMEQGIKSGLALSMKPLNPDEDTTGYGDYLRTRLRSVQDGNTSLVLIPPRGVGPTSWRTGEFEEIQKRRRFHLLGQTRAGMRVYDVIRAVAALEQVPTVNGLPLTLSGQAAAASQVLLASLFSQGVSALELYELPSDARQGPAYQNLLRVLDYREALAMAAFKMPVRIYHPCHRDVMTLAQYLADHRGHTPVEVIE